MSLVIVLAAAGIANGVIYDFNGVFVEIEYWTGTGTNEALMVVDWQREKSLAFGYRWYDSVMAGDMFDAVDEASAKFYKEWVSGEGDSAIFGIGYDMDNDGFSKNDAGDYYEEGWFENGFWAEVLSNNGQSWDWGNGIRSDYLYNGTWVGFSWSPEFAYSDPNPPIIPEPTTLVLLGAGGLFFRRHRAQQKRVSK
jgi:hypothetical protein